MHADQEAHPALLEARQRELVEPVTKNRDADDDEAGDVPHRRGAASDPGARAARSRSVRAPSRMRAGEPAADPARSGAPAPRRRSARDRPGGPSAGCRSASRRRSRTRRRRRRRPAAARRRRRAVSASAGLAASTATTRSALARRRVGSHSTRPAGVIRKVNGPTAGSSVGQPLSSIFIVRPACGRSRSTAAGSAAIT